VKKTQWYSGDVKPVRIGVYEVQAAPSGKTVGFKFWNGARWSIFAFEKENAIAFKRHPSGFQGSVWRGLREKAK